MQQMGSLHGGRNYTHEGCETTIFFTISDRFDQREKYLFLFFGIDYAVDKLISPQARNQNVIRFILLFLYYKDLTFFCPRIFE